MRSSRLLLVFGVLVAASQACVNDEPNTGSLDLDGGSLDAAAPDTGVPGSDAAPVEGGAFDAGPDTGSGGPVTVIVTDRFHSPVAGVKIGFVEPSGTANFEITDAQGKASHALSAGGTVWAADATNPGSRRVTTIFSVEADDVLAIEGGGGSEPLTPPPFATLGLAQPAQLFGGASSTEIVLCGSPTSIASDGTIAADIDIPASCVVNGKVDVLGIARNSSNVIVAYAVEHVGVTQGTKATFTIGSADWTGAVGNAFSFTGTPPAYATGAGLALDFFKSGIFFLESHPAAALNNNPRSFDAPPDGFADLFQAFSILSFEDGADGGTANGFEPVSILLTQGAVPAVDTNVAAAFADFPPRIHDVSVTGIATPQITWQEDAPLTGAVGGFLALNGTINVEGGLDNFEWDVVFPPGSPSIALPAFPGNPPEFTPNQELQLTSLGVVASPELGTYKNFRAGAAAYSGLVNEITYPVPPKPLTVKVSGLRTAIAN